MNQGFLKIKQKYITTFPQKAEDIDNAWKEKDIASLRAQLHKLAGSSGSYGFDHVNQLCYDAMEILGSDVVNEQSVESVIQQILNSLRHVD